MAEKKQKKSLGKGLGALFADVPGEDVGQVRDIVSEIEQSGKPASDKKNVVFLKLVEIEPNKNQPRRAFDTEKLEALRSSIAEHGVIQPILVTPTQNGTYKIVAGERRWRAAKLAGLKEMPCVIRDFQEQTVMELALVENLQREDLNPIEEAEGYLGLMEQFSLTQDEIAQKVGKSRSAVANALRLNHLVPQVKKLVIDGALTQGHARALVSVEDPDRQLALAEQVVQNGLSVRQVEALVAGKAIERKKTTAKKASLLTRYYKEVEDTLSARLGTKVVLRDGAKKGKIEIEYYSKDDLERILFELRR